MGPQGRPDVDDGLALEVAVVQLDPAIVHLDRTAHRLGRRPGPSQRAAEDADGGRDPVGDGGGLAAAEVGQLGIRATLDDAGGVGVGLPVADEPEHQRGTRPVRKKLSRTAGSANPKRRTNQTMAASPASSSRNRTAQLRSVHGSPTPKAPNGHQNVSASVQAPAATRCRNIPMGSASHRRRAWRWSRVASITTARTTTGTMSSTLGSTAPTATNR